MQAGYPKIAARSGFSLLELQVAFVLFGIALAGLGPLVVMQSKQLQQLENRLDDQNTYYLVPSTDAWAGKLGAAASLDEEDPGPPAPAPVTLIDDGDPGYSEQDAATADWVSENRATAFNGALRRNDGAHVADKAIWQFADLETGWYEVLVTWEASWDQASDAPYTVYDGATPLGTVRVNQRLAPGGGNPCLGLQWESLGVFLVQTGALRVELSDDADGNIAADAVRIAAAGNIVQVLSVDRSFAAEEASARVSVTVQVP